MIPAAVPAPPPAVPSPVNGGQASPDLFPMPVIGPKQGIFVTGNVPKSLPPFPAIPSTRTGKTMPPIPVRTGMTVAPMPIRTGKTLPPIPVPHLNVQGAVIDDQDVSARVAEPRGARSPLIIIAAIVALVAGGSFGWRYYQSKRLAAKTPTAAVSDPAPVPEKPAPPEPTPSVILNQIAQAPGNAISKAQDALSVRRAGEQSRVDAVAAGEDIPDRPVRKASASAPKSPAVSTMTPVAPGLTASAPIEAESDAGAEFRLFVANLKVKGVFQGEPPRAVINGRLMRAGERIDADLGVIFVGLDADRHRLIFKDRTGATIQRKY